MWVMLPTGVAMRGRQVIVSLSCVCCLLLLFLAYLPAFLLGSDILSPPLTDSLIYLLAPLSAAAPEDLKAFLQLLKAALRVSTR